MTVAQLIAILKELPANLPVSYGDRRGGDPIYFVRLSADGSEVVLSTKPI